MIFFKLINKVQELKWHKLDEKVLVNIFSLLIMLTNLCYFQDQLGKRSKHFFDIGILILEYINIPVSGLK
jgi:hypothetical protein